jgi:hypothetical protein
MARNTSYSATAAAKMFLDGVFIEILNRHILGYLLLKG